MVPHAPGLNRRHELFDHVPFGGADELHFDDEHGETADVSGDSESALKLETGH
jgi:hypothetical protein